MMSFRYTRFKVDKYYIGKNVDKSLVVFKVIKKGVGSTLIKILKDDCHISFTFNNNITLLNRINYGCSAICFTNAVEIKDDAKLLALLM